ncbi:DUF3298 and DUF4163 domain-containing protein [Tahibacter amnicola]|uniref:DUF3298 and DUF4163 domain-containing protein n=1 Tax=Tahibacter amnicola TaxID=2976241 RepID=A0ABY6BHU1_9GAMM|nr:DUF3298 and DUF4163 domain-containing protein [Tahibacter amnicola]UXI69082.1 DUF3298 and DUF4163 domain-containing protein [Tahibacter amnicola]
MAPDRYAITYPTLADRDQGLLPHLHAFAEQQKRNFRAEAGKRPATVDTAVAEGHLRLDFALRNDTDDFVSIVATGEMYTGGARGVPLLAAFNWHRGSRQVIALPDLFDNRDAGLRAIAAHVRRELTARGRRDPAMALTDRDRMLQGTAPVVENYATYFVHGSPGRSGITVIFPPYQVAPYARGFIEIPIPGTILLPHLKKNLRRTFAATVP